MELKAKTISPVLVLVIYLSAYQITGTPSPLSRRSRPGLVIYVLEPMTQRLPIGGTPVELNFLNCTDLDCIILDTVARFKARNAIRSLSSPHCLTCYSLTIIHLILVQNSAVIAAKAVNLLHRQRHFS